MIVLYGIAIFVFVLFIIAHVRRKRNEGEWLDYRQHFKDVWFILSQLINVLAGRRAQRITRDRADGKYDDLSSAQLIVAHDEVCKKMLLAGWTVKDLKLDDGKVIKQAYKWRVLDCEEFARKKAVEIEKWLAGKYEWKNGIPVGTLAYMRDDGQPHEIVVAYVHGEPTYLEAYAEEEYRMPLELSKSEKASIHAVHV